MGAGKTGRQAYDDAVVIIISSFASSLVYILIDKMTQHLNHPLVLAGSLPGSRWSSPLSSC